MGKSAPVDTRFLQPLESMAKGLEMAEVPLMLVAGNSLATFVEQASAVIGAAVIYTSQADFEAQFRASLPKFEYLFIVIDCTLTDRTYRLLYAYMLVRDVLGSDDSELKQLGLGAPHEKHRVVLFVDLKTFESLDSAQQETMSDFCTRIVVR